MGDGHLRDAHGGLTVYSFSICKLPYTVEGYIYMYQRKLKKINLSDCKGIIGALSNDSVNSWFDVYFYLSLHGENNVHVGGWLLTYTKDQGSCMFAGGCEVRNKMKKHKYDA